MAQNAAPPFQPVTTLYDWDNFQVYWGSWKGGSNCLGIRWGHSPAPGYYLVTTDELVAPWLLALIGTAGADRKHQDILSAVNDLISRGHHWLVPNAVHLTAQIANDGR